MKAIGDVEINDMKRTFITMLLSFEGLDNCLVRSEVSELEVRGGAIEGGEGGEFFVGRRGREEGRIEVGRRREDSCEDDVGEVSGDTLDGVT